MTKYLAVVIGILLVSNVYLLMNVREGKRPPLEPATGISISPHLIQTINRDEMPDINQKYYDAYKDSKSHFAFVSMDQAKERGVDDEIFHVLYDAYKRSSNVFELLYLFGIHNRNYCKLRFESHMPGQDIVFRRIVVEGMKELHFEGHATAVFMIVYDVSTGKILNMGFYSAFY